MKTKGKIMEKSNSDNEVIGQMFRYNSDNEDYSFSFKVIGIHEKMVDIIVDLNLYRITKSELEKCKNEKGD